MRASVVEPPNRTLPRNLRSQLVARQRLVHAAADVRLPFLDDAAVAERHAHVAGVALRIGIVRVDDVADLRGEREHARIADGLVAERGEADVAAHEGDGDVERRRELRGVGVRRPVLALERLPQPRDVALRGLADDVGDVLGAHARAPRACARNRCTAGSSSRSRTA